MKKKEEQNFKKSFGRLKIVITFAAPNKGNEFRGKQKEGKKDRQEAAGKNKTGKSR